jgi:hypothetical protein
MANVIKCPSCGENNLSDQEFCQFCQTRLQPLAGDIKGEDQPLTPGQIPTKKSTAELEPVLPQWLRDVRNSARQTSEEEPAQPAQQTPPLSRSASSSADLLAGLHAQRQEAQDEEEDTPDWLANITGETPKPKKPQAESPDLRWVELGDKKDFAHSEPEPETPPWLSGISPVTPQNEEKDELTDWLRAANASQESQQPSQPFSFDNPPSTPAADETQDWLHSMVSDDGAVFNDSGNAAEEPFTTSDTPDWLRALDAENAAQNAGTPSSASSTPPAFSDTPDWLRAMDTENAGAPSGVAATPPAFSEAGPGEFGDVLSSADDTPDWLKGLESAAPSSDQDWLKSLQPADEQPSQAAPAESGVDIIPAPPEKPAQEQPSAQSDADLDIPSWLKAAAPQSSIFTEPSAAQETSAPASSSDMPDWLNTFKSAGEPEAQAAPTFSDKPARVEPPSTADTAKPAADSDALFTEMPDWLSIADDTASPESIPAPITNTDAIAPGDLPSWVQAMRPVDAGVPQTSTSLSGDKKPELRGALAGLQGVLPAGTGLISTSKPKAYSVKLQASEEQQAHAALLEQILSAETAPVPIDTFSVLGTSRGLRWFLVFLFFVILTVVLVMRTSIFLLPVAFPVEAVSALNVMREAIVDDARVLVIFDYEPARAAEIEAAAVPMFDAVMRLRYPRLTFVSTNESGAILAERFISSGPLAEINYQSGSQYLNLGYLPGGQMGIRAFAADPIRTIKYPFPQSLNLLDFRIPALAQTFPPLEGVSSLSNFKVLVLFTDDADSARAWIEQTTPARGTSPLVVVSSAQAAPMLQPYYASKQISGLVSGIYGGALFEQNNEGRSSTVRAYWDAYSIGMLLAMALILGGGLVNLALGLRDRAVAREAK